MVYEIAQADPVPEAVKQLAGPAATGASYYSPIVVKMAVTAGVVNTITALQNPFGVDVLIKSAVLRIITAGTTTTAVLDVDVVGSTTATGDDIFDGMDATATGVTHSGAAGAGTNAEHTSWLWEKAGGTNDYLSAKILVEEAADLVADLFAEVIPAAT